MNSLQAFSIALDLVRNTDWSIRHRQQILETAYTETVGVENVWKVVGITKDCLIALYENDFNYNAVKPVRSHVNQRRETFLNVLESDMDAEEVLKYMAERDIAIISLRSENKDDGSLEAFIDIDPTDGMFKSKMIGFNFHKDLEKPYLKNICENLELFSL